jgi:NADH:ubiquinone oxidoreductase subunit E
LYESKRGEEMNKAIPIQDAEVVEIDYMGLDRIIEDEYKGDKENLIMILQAIQRVYNYLPRPALAYVSERLNVPLSKICGVGTFYKTFSLEPRGRNIISVCLGTACHVRDAQNVSERIQEILNAPQGETTKDGRFTLEPVRCTGCCSHGPIVKVNEDIYSGITPEKVKEILNRYA